MTQKTRIPIAVMPLASFPREEKRRLHQRFPTVGRAILRFSGMDVDEAPPIMVDITDISKDSLSCRASGLKPLDIGTEINLSVLDRSTSRLLQGKVVNCSSLENNQIRMGVRLTSDEQGALNMLTSRAVTMSVDRRISNRRGNNVKSKEKRKFERRGVWKGLLAKRYFSEYIWSLKTNDVYFFAKPIASAVGSHVKFGGRDMIMMASNNYLGLNTHPAVKKAAIDAIKKYGTGSSGSNLVGGTYDIHLELEAALAKFIKVEEVCICISGYVANTTTLTTILGKEDAVFNDALNHASLIDGSMRNGAYLRIFRHNDMKDLEKKLAACKNDHKLVVADAVFSMDGDIAPLPDIFRLCKKYNAALMLDQAHSTGVFGKTGAGVLEHFDMDGKADVIVGTMSKSLAAVGGFIGGSRELINILKHSAREIFFSTNVPPSACASILMALKVMREEPERRQTLWRNTEKLRHGLEAMGFNIGPTQSPIIPVIFPVEMHTSLMAKELLAQDIYVTPIPYPAVKKNQTRIRLSTIATHSEEDIDKTLMAFKQAKRKLKL